MWWRNVRRTISGSRGGLTQIGQIHRQTPSFIIKLQKTIEVRRGGGGGGGNTINISADQSLDMEKMLGLSAGDLKDQFYNARDLDRATNCSYSDITR